MSRNVVIETQSGKVYPYTRRETAYKHARKMSTDPRVLEVWVDGRLCYVALGEVFLTDNGPVQYAHGKYRTCVSVSDLRGSGYLC